MQQKVLKVQPSDNVIVALVDLKAGEVITFEGKDYTIKIDMPAKHKFAQVDFEKGDSIFMYGVLVGKAQQKIEKGEWITVFNVKHAANDFKVGERKTNWDIPNVSDFEERTFLGYHRADGSVGTANYWIVLPLVFCENKNLEIMKSALVEDLGYGKKQKYQKHTQALISLHKAGKSVEEILSADFETSEADEHEKLFKNVDGVKFLSHDMGCGGTRQDAQALCGLLAGYITHPNVAGATVLSLGCQNAQYSMLQEELDKRGGAGKPVFFLEQQQLGTEEALVSSAIKQTFVGLIEANKIERKPAGLDKLIIGLECGGSDGFSGISANPAIGYTSDLLVALGGTVILAEFPELCGVEQELSDRCVEVESAERFSYLMKTYNDKAVAAGSGFDMNPSPGNIKDGLITDAIKSAGAAKKGGTSPVVAVLDYPEKVTKKGLNLLCTPGNDVESTTAEVGSGANIVLFTTGLGTPTGNPIAPVIKLASNTKLAQKMSDIIDINTGSITEGTETIEEAGRRILDFVIEAASGKQVVKSVQNQQDDFIPWKRGVSL
ncbi:UxaA family hydrolase [Lacihabitans lacunae]|jgi:altronate hydrolase|uniref:UxaA family hydrolase n=1 Tax=Lacihabitans lacunae TaxID=1028214 RepID=A0ABV7YZU2_9BACT